MAPLLDIIFILLIFFAVSTTLIVNQQGLKLDLPQAESTQKQPKGIVISVDKQKKIFINKQLISLSDLTAKVQGIVSDDDDQVFIFNADKGVPYEMVVTVLDQIRLGGGTSILLQAEKKTLTDVYHRTRH